jgi:protein-S-isoprenylcysteine O-methyltransferase Ste14
MSADVSLVWRVGGAVLFAAGLSLFVWCVALFVRIGKGTLAPWDPTQALVAIGPYRLVRNPMITGVALMLAGESLFFRSWHLAAWTALFVMLNHGYFLALEEPGLRRRFGEPYRRYAAAVPRWLPRFRRGA